MKLENNTPEYISWYCKCRKAKGSPMAIYNTKTKTIKWCKGLPRYITRYKVRIKCDFNNTMNLPIAKNSGATTALHIWRLKGKNNKLLLVGSVE